MFRTHKISRILSLAARWRALGMMAVIFARQVSMMTKMGSHSGAQKAELLEAWIYAALIRLSADIAAASECGHPCKEDRAALTYLKTVHALLSVLALLMAAIKRELAGAEEKLRALAGISLFSVDSAGRCAEPRHPEPDFNDSS